MAIPGLDNYGASSGTPPYAESRWKAILRNAALGIGSGFGAGLGAVPPGANFGTAFLASMGASSKAATAAQQAAQEYAMKQQQMEEDRQYRELQGKYLEAQIKQMENPPKPPDLYDKVPWYERPEYKDTPAAKEARAKANYIAPKDTTPKQEKLVQVMGPNGKTMWVPTSQAIGKEPPRRAGAVTPAERAVLGYYLRAKDASDTITTLDQSGKSLEDKMARQSLLQQARLQSAPNILQTSDQQVYRQAQRAFTEARLRKESGAAIPQQEYENDARTYFARPGDSKATIERKRKARQKVLDGLKNSSGNAYNEYYSGPQSQESGPPPDAVYNPETDTFELPR